MATTTRMSKSYESYLHRLKDDLDQAYMIAKEARQKGYDPSTEPEPKIASDMAERIEQLVGPKGVADRIRELSKLMDRQDLAFKIAEETVYGRFGHLEPERAVDQAVRTGLAILTEAITIAPIQGVTEVRIRKNADGTKYLAIYFAGPIRPAGGTAQALTLVLGDFVRRQLGLGEYRPREDTAMRFLEEVRLYERRVRRFQYHVSDSDVLNAVKGMPVEATGVSTDPYEVSTFRDIPGVETNRIRGGALIVVVDGVIGRAKKLLGICQKLHIDGWDFLSGLGSTNGVETSARFMEEIIIGRPVFSFPGAAGGLRLRYGRARNTGLAAVGMHPASMLVLKRFLTTGVQLRIELPGKSAVVTPVDSIESSVVRLRDASVVRVESVQHALDIAGEIEKILFVGDVLINAGDFLQNNENLLPPSFDEQQWRLALSDAVASQGGLEEASSKAAVVPMRLRELLSSPSCMPSEDESLRITEYLGCPVHPRYTYMWSDISKEEWFELRSYVASCERRGQGRSLVLVGPSDGNAKSIMEKLLFPHGVSSNQIRLVEAPRILESCLAVDKEILHDTELETGLDCVRRLGAMNVQRKASVYVGARMGRPEKAKERKMDPYVHVLFPLGNAGGAERDVVKASKQGVITVELERRVCPRCRRPVYGVRCEACGAEPVTEITCPRCGRALSGSNCPSCNVPGVAYGRVSLDLSRSVKEACANVKQGLPELMKGVKSLMNGRRVPERLEKGVLRAKYDLSVFKDGTIRFDVTDAPLTHFKPSEIGTAVERLRTLGYTADRYGNPLEDENQMLELKTQDIVVPDVCGDYLVRVARFIDDELEHIYGLEKFYSAKNRQELIGHLVLGLAPHISAAIVGRVIGYTEARVIYAHPLWHAGKRRNCDGDEDAVLLPLDALLNFSNAFLPEQIGGLMDAPLFIVPCVMPSEVDKEAHNVDVGDAYAPQFYAEAQKGSPASDYRLVLDTIENRLGTEAQFEGFGYTCECSDINLGSHKGAYTSLETMMEKLEAQLELSEQLRAVDVREVARGILTSHFLKDIVGNLRAFTSQGFRCMSCNRKYRRPPLAGTCPKCGGKLSLTVYQGGITKYLDSAEKLIDRYDLGTYYRQRLALVREELDSLFPREDEKEDSPRQLGLSHFLKKA